MVPSTEDNRALDALRQSWPGAFQVQRSSDDYRAAAIVAAAELASDGRGEIDRLFNAMQSDRPRLVWSPTEQDLPPGPLTFLRDYWLQRKRGDDLPLSAGIDAVDLVPAIGYLMLLEPIEDTSNFRYRVYGTRIVEYSRVEMTGRSVWDVPAPWVATYFVATYRAVCDRRQPLYAQHRARVDRYFAEWDRLILPFVDAAGEVDRLLVGNVPSLNR